MSLLITKGLGSSGGSAVPSLVSVTPSATEIVLVFSENVVLSGDALVAANWLMTPTLTGYTPTCNSVSASTNEIVLGFSGEHTNGQPYELTIPTGILSDTGANYTGPFVYSYVGVGVGPVITTISPNITEIMITYNEPVVQLEAEDAANYNITGPTTPTISSVNLVINNVYRIVLSSALNSGANYTLTVSNIHDIYGNVVH